MYFFLLILNFFYDFIFHKSEIRTVLLEVGIDLGLLKKALLKTSKIVLMYSNSLARQFSSMFHAKCLLPRLDELLHVRSCLQNFYQCYQYHYDYHWKNYNAPPFMLIKCKNLMKFMNFKLPSCPEQTQISILFHKKSP